MQPSHQDIRAATPHYRRRLCSVGRPKEEGDVREFVAELGSMPDGVLLANAAFRSASQSRFLRHEILEDADWAQVIDELNLMLHR
jgi:hypothetical protein